MDNGVTVWGFEIAGQATEAQTFAIVVRNTLASLKGTVYRGYYTVAWRYGFYLRAAKTIFYEWA